MASTRRSIGFRTGDGDLAFEMSAQGLNVSLCEPRDQLNVDADISQDDAIELAEFILENQPGPMSTTVRGDLIRSNYRLVRAIEEAIEAIELNQGAAVEYAVSRLRAAIPEWAESPQSQEPDEFRRAGIRQAAKEHGR